MSEIDDTLLSDLDKPLSPDNAIDIPNFESEENKPLFVPGTYLFALGHITPKVENGVTISVAQKIWVLKFIGDPYDPVNEWRIKFGEDGKLWMPTHKGATRTEFFDNPFLKPKMKWKTTAFYSIFPGVIINKASQVPGSDKPIKECNWKAVASKYGQLFEADLVTNNYTDKQGNKKTGLQFNWDTFKLVEKVIPVDQMVAIESRYEESKASENNSAGEYAAPPKDTIDEDLPF